jgi:hypothetical protein
MDAVLAARSRTASQTSHRGVTAKSSRFIETCARSGCPRSAHGPRTRSPAAGQSRTRFTHAPRDALREIDVVGIEVDVVGDQERSGPDGDGTRGRMHPVRTVVGLASVLLDLDLQSLVLAATDVARRSRSARSAARHRGRRGARNGSRSAPRTHGRRR